MEPTGFEMDRTITQEADPGYTSRKALDTKTSVGYRVGRQFRLLAAYNSRGLPASSLFKMKTFPPV